MMLEKDVKLQKAYMLVVLIDAYYDTESTGGCVSIILAYGNYGKVFAQHCLDYAIEQKDYWGEHIATLLTEFEAEEQEQIVERPYEIINQMYEV